MKLSEILDVEIDFEKIEVDIAHRDSLFSEDEIKNFESITTDEVDLILINDFDEYQKLTMLIREQNDFNGPFWIDWGD